MDLSRTEQIHQQLWPAGQPVNSRRVFAVLDGARDEKIEPMVRKSKLPHDCLYYEPLTDKLRAAAPHIIELAPEAVFTKRLIEAAWGKSWGIFLITEPAKPLFAVKQNCRKLTMVESPDGQRLLFRYYDPRVMRVYLATCTPEELQAVFGPVSRIMMEGETATELLQFSNTNTGCNITTHQFQG
ncbi:MAG: DUF4123 domain-containing protein [Gammaproteobacteria bacterium]|nr:DUF4123 domain-containing protein [Gammaproteobacteria bacterium]MDH5651825.1 DUF4123 domain-containing protein [Gammaproteobacteria bacterium]